MQNWQKNRNYRKYENADGSFTYIIMVDGEDVEINETVYKTYSKAHRRERYCEEREVGKLLSFEGMGEADELLSYLMDHHTESAEDTAIRKSLINQVMAAFSLLSFEEQRLIQAVVMDGVTEQEFAEDVGVTQVAVHKRKKRILKKLLNLMVIN